MVLADLLYRVCPRVPLRVSKMLSPLVFAMLWGNFSIPSLRFGFHEVAVAIYPASLGLHCVPVGCPGFRLIAVASLSFTSGCAGFLWVALASLVYMVHPQPGVTSKPKTWRILATAQATKWRCCAKTSDRARAKT